MRISISHLALTDNSYSTLELLAKAGVSNIEVVLSKLPADEFLSFQKSAREVGLTIESAQSILFNSGVSDLTDDSFANYLISVIPIYEKLGVQTLVLGSPNQRRTINFEKLSDQFYKIDEALSLSGMTLCIEPNSKKYNGTYFFNVSDIIDFMRFGNFSNIKTMIDTHNLILEGFDPSQVLIENFDKIHHVHVSEVNLGEFIESACHLNFSKSLSKIGYTGLITYETLASKNLSAELNLFVKTFS